MQKLPRRVGKTLNLKKESPRRNVGVFFLRGEVIRESSAEKIICCCSLRLEKNSEPLAAKENLPAAGKLKLSFPGLAWPAQPTRQKLYFQMDLTMSGLSLILEVSSQRGLSKRRSWSREV